MCDTILREQSYSGEKIDFFLGRALLPPQHPRVPRLTVETVQRLMGHIDPKWISKPVLTALNEIQGQEPGHDPIDRLIAPAFRTIDDFKNCGSVVVRAAGSDKELWRHVSNPLADEVNGKVWVALDDLTTVGIDPRSPTLWTAEDYAHINDRPHRGQGHFDKTAGIAAASIGLSLFSKRPSVHERYIDAALRRFTLTGIKL